MGKRCKPKNMSIGKKNFRILKIDHMFILEYLADGLSRADKHPINDRRHKQRVIRGHVLASCSRSPGCVP